MSGREDEARDQRAREAEAWRAIVDNYGDPVLDESIEATPEPPAEAQPGYFRFEPYDEEFVPPPLPPPAHIAPERRAAWIGLTAAPAILVLCALIAFPLAPVLTGALVLIFLVSFGYLVATMPREPRDPDDDGARL